jgi:hypothetical protein
MCALTIVTMITAYVKVNISTGKLKKQDEREGKLSLYIAQKW